MLDTAGRKAAPAARRRSWRRGNLIAFPGVVLRGESIMPMYTPRAPLGRAGRYARGDCTQAKRRSARSRARSSYQDQLETTGNYPNPLSPSGLLAFLCRRPSAVTRASAAHRVIAILLSRFNI